MKQNFSTHPFKNFDFSLLKQNLQDFENPIAQLLAQQLIFSNSKQGYFLPIPFPTGIGKTHNILIVLLEVILHRIHYEIYTIAKLENIEYPSNHIKAYQCPIFITNSVDNVQDAYHKLISFIDKDIRFNSYQKDYLKKSIIYLPKNTTCLENAILNDEIDGVLEIFNLSNDNQIKHNINKIKINNSSLQRENRKNYLYQVLKKESEQLLNETWQIIQGRINTFQHSKNAKIFNKKQQQLLTILYPAIKLDSQTQTTIEPYHAFFMTTKKFLHGITLPSYKYYFTQEIKDYMLVIDEIDRQNDEILTHLIEQKPKNILQTARTLLVNLSTLKLSTKPYYHGIESVFENFYQKLDLFHKKYDLYLNMDTEEKTQNAHTLSPMLFSDKLATHLTNINTQLYFYYDKTINQHIIFGNKYFSTPSTYYKFNHFINKLSRLVYHDFIIVLINSAHRYIKNSLENNSNPSIDFMSAINTILKQFNLYELRYEFNIDLLLHIHKKYTFKNKHDGSYHTRGINLIEIYRQKDVFDSIDCRHFDLAKSPTALLTDWVEQQTKIIGISATANHDSVIHNFDMDYLNYRLADKFIQLDKVILEKIQDYYNQQRNYKDININFHEIIDNLNDFAINHAPYFGQNHVLISNTSNNELLYQHLEKALNYKSDINHFYLRALDKICLAIKEFYKTHHYGNRYMMIMLNRFLKDEIQQKFIQDYIEKLDKQYQQRSQVFHVDAKFLKTEGYHTIKSQLKTTQDRIIVFTTYQTLSSGANPDYEFNECEYSKLIAVSQSSYISPTTDIDSLYLELPTNIISGEDIDSENFYTARLKLLAYGMALLDAGKLTQTQAQDWVRKIISHQGDASTELKKRFYNYQQNANGDFIHASCRTVEQAIGRMNRSAYKRSNIFIYFDNELRKVLVQENFNQRISSHEYKGLVKYIKDTNQAQHKSSLKDKDSVLRQLQAKANTKNQRNNAHLKQLLSSIQELEEIVETTDKSLNVVENWIQLREFIIQYPCVNEISYPNQQYYIELPMPSNHYFYQGNIENDCNFFTEPDKSKQVSEEYCQLDVLMKNKIIKEYFIQNNYATSWREQSKFIISPILFNNIYKAYLGEVSAKAILLSQGFNIDELPIALFEEFDNIIEFDKVSALIDFKHWNLDKWKSLSDELKKDTMQKIENKLKKIQNNENYTFIPNKLVICNLLGDHHQHNILYYDENFIECAPFKAKIMTISALIDKNTGDMNLNVINCLKLWLKGNI